MGLHLLGTQVRAPAAIGPPLILMWSGSIADIPVGFDLCDGTHGTPDLRDRFVIPSNDPSNPHYGPDGDTGPNFRDRGHEHPLFDTAGEPGPLHTHDSPSWTTLNTLGVLTGGGIPILVGAFHVHNVSTYSVGPAQVAHYHRMFPTPPNTAVTDARPPFYALAFIRGPVAVAPLGTIVHFAGNPTAAFVAGPTLTALAGAINATQFTIPVSPPLDIGAGSGGIAIALAMLNGELLLVYDTTSDPANWAVGRSFNGVVAAHGAGAALVGSVWAFCNGAQGTLDLESTHPGPELFIIGAGNTYTVGDTGGTSVITNDAPAHIHGAGSAAVDDEASHVHRQKISDPAAPSPPVGNPAETARDGQVGGDDTTTRTTAQTLVPIAGAIVLNPHRHGANSPGAVGTVGVPDTLAGTPHAHNPLVATNPAYLSWVDDGILPSGYFVGFLQRVA